jgi:hypothetical protein
MNTNRRNFLKASALFGLGMVMGLPDLSVSQESKASLSAPKRSTMTRFCTPRGGCTEANFALFDKGPCGRGPFDSSF